ncbi:MAG: DUF438 domain-containing protein [Chitinivibrionales bacterium]|nr:DUF438 domain-containing protein [Chitinivibrionales bacterium]
MEKVSGSSKIKDLLTAFPFLLDFLPTISPGFVLLKNPLARKSAGSVATVAQAARIGGLTNEELLMRIAEKIKQETGATIEIEPRGNQDESQTVFSGKEARIEVLKHLIKDLHSGADVLEVKKRFSELIADVGPGELSEMEQQLISEGMPSEEVKRLCDVHVQVFKESLEKKAVPHTPQGHPVDIYMAENRALETLIDKIQQNLSAAFTQPQAAERTLWIENIKTLSTSLLKIDTHYTRKENQLFPVLEAYGIAGPSKVMWSLHDDIRDMVKSCRKVISTNDLEQFAGQFDTTAQALLDMIYKEEHILFPMALESLKQTDWQTIRAGEDDVGYAWIDPGDAGLEAHDVHYPPEQSQSPRGKSSKREKRSLHLDEGNLPLSHINLMLKHLPVEISFVDKEDTVRYYSATPERLFPRSPGVIGRAVQNCHPPKSLHMVEQILTDFKSGVRNQADFWITFKERFISIRYFAVRDDAGDYQGCLEVTQDITELKQLEGEKRLLD